MFRFLGISFGTLVRLFCSQKSLLLENLALTPAAFCAETPPSTPKARVTRQALLADRSPLLVRLETGTLGCHAGNRGPLAPRRFPLVLEGCSSPESHPCQLTGQS